MKTVNSFDIDGVVFVSDEIGGIYPGPHDVIITGRSYEEKPETLAMLHDRGIYNEVYFSPWRFEEKTRVRSGEHKAETLLMLFEQGVRVHVHYEDDDVQAAEIRKWCPGVSVIMVVHDLTEKENIRRPYTRRHA